MEDMAEIHDVAKRRWERFNMSHADLDNQLWQGKWQPPAMPPNFNVPPAMAAPPAVEARAEEAMEPEAKRQRAAQRKAPQP